MVTLKKVYIVRIDGHVSIVNNFLIKIILLCFMKAHRRDGEALRFTTVCNSL